MRSKARVVKVSKSQFRAIVVEHALASAYVREIIRRGK